MIDPLFAMKRVNQWVVCKDKLPVDYRTGEVANAHDPAIHTSYAIAKAYPGHHPGFVFTHTDPFFFVDVDKCLDAVTNTWLPIVAEISLALPGAACEVSISTKGLHFFGTYTGEIPEHSCKNLPLGVELYTQERFAIVTETNIIGDSGTDLTLALKSLIDKYFQPKESMDAGGWTTEADPEWVGPDDDAELIKRFLKQGITRHQAFLGEPTNEDLWTANAEVLGRKWPDGGGKGRAYDASGAEASLAARLAFWTGNNSERIAKLMRQSALYRSRMDDSRYMHMTITGARSNQVYKDPRTPLLTPRQTDNPMPTLLSGPQILTPSNQIDLFKGCVYITDINSIYTPVFGILDKARFDIKFGGYKFIMGQDCKDITSAWDAFTISQAVRYPQVETSCFLPNEPPGAIVQQAVNTYVEIHTERKVGDVSRFLDFLSKLLPNKQDRTILLSYMATCVQHKGFKIQWAPVIIGVEGNGKSLLTRCMIHALSPTYAHMPKASKIDSDFNAWISRALFVGVEELYAPGANNKLVEALKPMITCGPEGIEVQPKGVDQRTVQVYCNFMFNSNHQDAIKLTENNRRFAVFHTAQQHRADIDRDGMGGDYFPSLYAWLDREGYAIVNQFLVDYKIPVEVDPRGVAHRAPETSSTSKAIISSLGAVEQEILEAIEVGRTGFANGWISSIAVDNLLKENRLAEKMPLNKRREMLLSLGYIIHTGLIDGRATRAVFLDGGSKPRLFVKHGHLSLNLKDPAAIVSAYEKAQGAATDGAIRVG